MYKIQYILFGLIFLLLISCESNSGNSKTSNTQNNNSSEEESAPGNTDINNIIKPNLSTEKAIFETLNDIPNISKVNASWLKNEWVTYNVVNKVSTEKYTFFEDGRYSLKTISPSATKNYLGKWVIYEEDSNGKLMMFLIIDNQLIVYALEREGENAFRLIPQFGNKLLRSKLYTRLDSDEDALSSGMFLLGTFKHKNFENSFTYTYTFTKDFNVIRTKEHRTNGSNLITDKGTWSINTNNTKLTLSFDGTTKSYNISDTATNAILLTINGEKEYWEKINEDSLKNIDNLVGEYQASKDANYISIRKKSNKYFVDLVENYSTANRYYNIEAEKIKKDVLTFIIPHREDNYNYNEGERVTLKIGYNRLYFLEYPLFGGKTNYEKVSKYPIITTNIIGTWKSTVFSASNYMISKYFFEDGFYLRVNDKGIHRGKYNYTDKTLTIKETCLDPQVMDISLENKFLKLKTIKYTANPGLRDWGDAGVEIAKIFAKNSFDLYQKENTPKLIPHPKYKGTYLFEKKTTFSSLSLVFTFNPDGTGSLSSVSSGTYVDSFSGYWRDNYQSGQTFGLKYFIFSENNREYISYYYDGAFTSYNENHYSSANGWTINSIEGDIKDVRIVELYHRRTSICYQSKAIYDESKGGTIMPLVK